VSVRKPLPGLAKALTAIALLWAIGIPAGATTKTANDNLTMKIANACVANNATVSFPQYLPNSPTAVTAAGNGASIACNVNDSWSIKASTGGNPTHASGTCGAATCTRAMADGAGHYIGYELFIGACCSGTTVWGTTAGHLITGTGDGTAQAIAFWGMVAASQNVPAGTYTDTVVATYTF